MGARGTEVSRRKDLTVVACRDGSLTKEFVKGFRSLQLSCQNCKNVVWLNNHLTENEQCKGYDGILPGAMWHSWVGAGVGVEGMLRILQSN